MADDDKGAIHTISGGGIAGLHPSSDPLDFLLGPTTTDHVNTLRFGLLPIACWRVDNVRFHFDSSFVLPEVTNEITALAQLRDLHKEVVFENSSAAQPQFVYPPISIFGHADPVGNDEYNKFLSGRRAAAIYGLLTRRTEIWEDLYSNTGIFAEPVLGDKWGEEPLKIMRDTTGLPVATPRSALFSAYMDLLCTISDADGNPLLDDDGQPIRLKLNAQGNDFLARGEDAHGKGDFQGCGEFNALLIFSKKDNDQFEQAKDKSLRNKANEPNRRVVALLFRRGSRVLFSKWPCPRAREGVAGCVKRFWSDGEKRRSTRLPDDPRRFQDTKDTFACRFFDRISSGSPCHSILRSFRIRLYDPTGKVIKSAPCRVTLGGNVLSLLRKADSEGFITLQDLEVPRQCIIDWGFPPEVDQAEPPKEDFPFRLEVFLTIDQGTQEKEAAELLNNLGYIASSLDDKVTAFQQDYGPQFGLEITGKLSEKTLTAIRKVHNGMADDLRSTPSEA